jgi:hypothetical protein
MQRRSLLFLGALLPLGLFRPRSLDALIPNIPSPTEQRETAEHLNELAANIRTPGDARRMVDFVAQLFMEVMPHALMTSSMRSRISDAEFSAVSDANKLIPEQRLADAWNAYAESMQAPDTCKVTAPEIHYLRDSMLVTARFFWDRSHMNFWSVPSIYATQADGGIARGCRAVESIRILWDLASQPESIKSARDGVRRGVLFSELLRQEQANSSAPATGNSLTEALSYTNPMDMAQRQYIQARGNKAYRKEVIKMVESALA